MTGTLFAQILNTELRVDLDEFDSTSAPTNVLERLAERSIEQVDGVIVETPAMLDALQDPAEGLRGHRQHESTLQSLKRIWLGSRAGKVCAKKKVAKTKQKK